MYQPFEQSPYSYGAGNNEFGSPNETFGPQPGSGKSLLHQIPHNPLSIADQGKAMVLNYGLNAFSYMNSKNGIKWQGVWGTRWLGGGTQNAGSGVLGRAAQKTMGFIPSRVGGRIVGGIWGSEAGGAFAKRGIKGIVEHFDWMGKVDPTKKKAWGELVYKAGHFMAGGNESYLIEAGEAAGKHAAKKVGLNGAGKMASFLKLGPKGMKIASGIGKVGSIASTAVMLGSFAYDVGKAGIRFAERSLDKINYKLNKMSQPDVYLAPQLINRYSQSMRSRALSVARNSNMNPANSVMGREAQFMHR